MTTFGPGDVREGATPLEVAHAYLGVHETGPNRGPRIDQWLRRCGLDPEGKGAPKGGYAWCAAFASCCCIDGGRPIHPSASVQRLWDANRELQVFDPQPGDLCLRVFLPGGNHIGFFIARPVPGVIQTIDGNTNEAGGREGNAVAIKTRAADYWTRFLRPPVRP